MMYVSATEGERRGTAELVRAANGRHPKDETELRCRARRLVMCMRAPAAFQLDEAKVGEGGRTNLLSLDATLSHAFQPCSRADCPRDRQERREERGQNPQCDQLKLGPFTSARVAKPRGSSSMTARKGRWTHSISHVTCTRRTVLTREGQL